MMIFKDYFIYIICFIFFITLFILFVMNEKRNIKEWLLYAVIYAEKELGERTGTIKLRKVYDMFINKFPFVSKIISFKLFSKMVDGAILQMKKILSTNIKCASFVKGCDSYDNIQPER